jgi:N-methylhydantoinase B
MCSKLIARPTTFSTLEHTMLDPVTLALVQKRLDHIAQQIGLVMIRTSRSPIFNQSHDFSCFLADSEGHVLTQADGIPIHTGGGGFAVRAVLNAFRGRMAPGDVFLLNDPYVAGGNHLPDWVVARPIFSGDRLCAFACIRAHQSDIGGGAAGTYNSNATEIFHEGIRLPVLKLIEDGAVRDDLWQLLMINTRTPHLLDGDLRAMLGGTQVGNEQILKLVEDIGANEVASYFEGVLDHAHRRFRAAVSALPDGTYRAIEGFDDDCFEPSDIEIVVNIVVSGGRIAVDFSGTAPQMRGFKNSSLANTYSAVYMALASFFDPDLPRNEGTFRSVTITAPKGTVVNAQPPAPCGFCTSNPAHQIVQACWKALGQAAPDRSCAGWGKKLFPVTSGSSGDGRTFVLYHWGANSGGGAIANRDGFDQIGPLETLGGLVLPNAETYEQLYPIRIVKQEFRCDSGGAGRFRGGTGVHYIADVEVEAEYSFRAEGVRRQRDSGANGGSPGALGQIRVYPNRGEPFEPPTYGVQRHGPLRLEILSPGGGGWGDPRERGPDLVATDVRNGVVGSEAAARDYGIAQTSDGERDLDAASPRSMKSGILSKRQS